MAEDIRDHDVAKGLTGIPSRIHCAATSDEAVQLQVNSFLDTLAEIAISVAKRMVSGTLHEEGPA